MRQAFIIYKRELKDYFVSSIAYIVISIFLLITGWFFFSAFFLYDQASLRNFFGLLPFTFAFVIPAVTMRLFSEELNGGTYETLLTLPVRFSDVVLGKFMAAVTFVGAMLIPTLAYPLTISLLGDLDWGPVWGGYFGALLLGAAFCAIGTFASSLARNQINAFIIGMIICFALVLLDKMLFFVPDALLSVLSFMAANTHFQNVAKGVIDTRDILYFVSIAFVGLYATHIAMQEKA